ncbi:TPA_asm: hypothetical protein [Macroli virus]|nr:TPA_asm: hypothetical protein [Macroli virus]
MPVAAVNLRVTFRNLMDSLSMIICSPMNVEDGVDLDTFYLNLYGQVFWAPGKAVCRLRSSSAEVKVDLIQMSGVPLYWVMEQSPTVTLHSSTRYSGTSTLVTHDMSKWGGH